MGTRACRTLDGFQFKLYSPSNGKKNPRKFVTKCREHVSTHEDKMVYLLRAGIYVISSRYQLTGWIRQDPTPTDPRSEIWKNHVWRKGQGWGGVRPKTTERLNVRITLRFQSLYIPYDLCFYLEFRNPPRSPVRNPAPYLLYSYV